MLSILQNRTTLSHFLIGRGIEIGALDGPLTIAHNQAEVRYADRMTTEELKKEYPTLAAGIRDVDFVVKDDKLPVADGSQDFIIGNHVIEHIVDPLGAIKEWHRTLKDGGIVFMAYPIPKFCPDAPRRIVTVEHLIHDFEAARRTNAGEHLLAFYWSWIPHHFPNPGEVEKVLRYLWANDLWEMDETAWSFLNESRARVEELLEKADLEVHQHAFDIDVFRAGLTYLADHADAHFSVEDLSYDRGAMNECILILQKHSHPPADGLWGPRARAAEARELYLSSDITADVEISRERLRIIQAMQERDAMLQEHNQKLVREVDKLKALNAEILNSRAWRATAPLRALKGYVSGRRL